MKKDIYRNYALVTTEKDKLTEIDWTKIKSFEHLRKSKYKLDKIDYFTSHYTNELEILKVLVESGLLALKQLKKVKLTIYPIKRDNNIIRYADRSIEGLIYKEINTALENDSYVISLLNTLIKDENFVNKLYDFYIVNGKYNINNLNDLECKIISVEENLQKNYSVKLQNILYAYKRMRKNFIDNINLIENISNYSRELNRYGHTSNNLNNSIKNNIEEFYLRQKYYVLSYEEGTSDRRILSFRKNKNNQLSVNYLEFHQLIVFIQNYITSKKEEPLQEKVLKKTNINPIYIDGQLSFFN